MANPKGIIPRTVTRTIPNPAAGTGTPLVYSPAAFNESDYAFMPSWIDVPAGQMSLRLPGVTPDDQYYNNFWVRAVNDNVRNVVEVVSSEGSIGLSNAASGRGAWAGAMGLNIVRITPTAFVTQQTGNTNLLTVTVTEHYESGAATEHVVTFTIRNNAEGTYQVGPYRVFVDTKGNTQIRACYIVP